METNVKITFYAKSGNHYCTYDDIPVLYEVSTGKPVMWVKSSFLSEEFKKELKRMRFFRMGMLVTPIPENYTHFATAFTIDKLKEFLVNVR